MPKSNTAVLCVLGSDGLYDFQLAGTYAGVAGDTMLLLWVKPVNPPSEPSGWLLQRPPHGVSYNNRTGVWHGTAQVGNAQYPPHNNDTFDVSVTLTDGNTATQLLNLPGVVSLAAPAGQVIGTVTSVRVALPSAAYAGPFVGSKNAHVYYYPSCYLAQAIKPTDLITFPTAADAQAAGYRPDLNCNGSA